MNTVTRILLNHYIDFYNTKLISSCLKQTLTLGAVTPTVTNTSEDVDGAKEALAAEVAEVKEITQSLNCCLTEN